MYAIEWDEGKIKFFVDDDNYYTFWNQYISYKEWPFDKRFHLLLNIAIGGTWGGAQGIDPNLTEASMEIDYVRVYSNDTIAPEISGPDFLQAGDTAIYNTYIYEQGEYQWTLPETTELITGQGTNEVKVVWGDSSGEVKVDVTIPGKSFETVDLMVDVVIIPSGDAFYIDHADENDSLLWVVENDVNNSLQPELSDEILKIDYNTTDIYENSCLVYRFKNPVDLTDYRVMELYIKSASSDPPGNMRIDLVDINGNVNPDELFEIVTFEEDEEFHEFHKVFGIYPDDNYLLDRVEDIRVYINWGEAGITGNGTVWIDSLRMVEWTGQVNSVTHVHDDIFSLFPNPAGDKINLEFKQNFLQNNRQIIIYSINGKPVYDCIIRPGTSNFNIPLNSFAPGYYIINVNSGKRTFTKVFVKHK